MAPPLQKTIYTGTFIHTPSLTHLKILENTAVGVDEDGIIAFIERLDDLYGGGSMADVLRRRLGGEVGRVWAEGVERGEGGVRWVEGGDFGGGGGGGGARGAGGAGGKGEMGMEEGRAWWFPGFVDTHIHASQYPNAGIFGTSTLLDWLNKYTNPLESSISSPTKAKKVYNACVRRTLQAGTTTAAYYATIHPASTNILADICLQKGQRAFIGRVCMDCKDTCPDHNRDESPETALAATKASIEHINTIDPSHTLITPIITPRFAPACTSSLLHSLGSLASTENLPIQTHISENPSEVALARSLYPSHDSYAHVYDTHNLLTARTVLAHAIHLSTEEKSLIKQRGASVSHCPVSNMALSSGICPVRELLELGIEVGLGTDVSGGYSASMLSAVREAVMLSRLRAALGGGDGMVAGGDGAGGGKDDMKLTVEESLYLATRGGAKCLGLGDKVGAFEVGMLWDAQLIQLHEVDDEDPDMEIAKGEDDGLVDLWGQETWAEKIAKWVFCGDDRNTRAVFVGGRMVKGSGR